MYSKVILNKIINSNKLEIYGYILCYFAPCYNIASSIYSSMNNNIANPSTNLQPDWK